MPTFLEYVYYEGSKATSDIFPASILFACILVAAIWWMEFAEAGRILEIVSDPTDDEEDYQKSRL